MLEQPPGRQPQGGNQDPLEQTPGLQPQGGGQGPLEQPPGQQPGDGQGPLLQQPQEQQPPNHIQAGGQNTVGDQIPDDQVAKSTGTKQKTRKQKMLKLFQEIPPFTITGRILSNKEFTHMTNARIVRNSILNVISWFHAQV